MFKGPFCTFARCLWELVPPSRRSGDATLGKADMYIILYNYHLPNTLTPSKHIGTIRLPMSGVKQQRINSIVLSRMDLTWHQTWFAMVGLEFWWKERKIEWIQGAWGNCEEFIVKRFVNMRHVMHRAQVGTSPGHPSRRAVLQNLFGHRHELATWSFSTRMNC